MSVSFITGKPGAGKSYYGVRQLCEELRLTKRYVVTNLPVNLEELAQWCHDHLPEGSEAMKRVRKLTDSETLQFWLYYAPGKKVTERCAIEDGERGIDYPDFEQIFRDDPSHPGTCFLIDEVHIFFNARRWHMTGSDCGHYFSQHRKLGHDVLLITQHEKQVDVALKNLCQDYTVLVNLEKTRIFGFSIPKTVRRATYGKLGDRDPMETGMYRFNFEQYGKLYDTNAGVGIVGRADKTEKKGGGKHPIWLLVYAAAFIAFCWYFPPLVTGTIRKIAARSSMKLHTIGEENATKTAQLTNAPVKMPVQVSNLVHSSTNISAVAKVQSVPKSAELTIERRIIVGSYRVAWLSDGRVIRQGDPDCLFFGDDYLILRPGKTIWKKQ